MARRDSVSYRLQARKYQLKRLYGLSMWDYHEMLRNQDGVCAICGNPEGAIDPRTGEPNYLSVDHNHETGEVRGLLCNNCNNGLGRFRDNPNILQAAIEYLRAE